MPKKKTLPNHRERIEHLRSRYIADDSFAEAMLGLIDSGGWSEVEAAAALKRTYEQAFAHGLASEKPWILETVRLLEEQGIQRALQDKPKEMEVSTG